MTRVTLTILLLLPIIGITQTSKSDYYGTWNIQENNVRALGYKVPTKIIINKKAITIFEGSKEESFGYKIESPTRDPFNANPNSKRETIFRVSRGPLGFEYWIFDLKKEEGVEILEIDFGTLGAKYRKNSD